MVPYMTLATADASGQPWNSPLFTAHDEHYNFYWTSPARAHHSQNILTNNKIFLVIFSSQAIEGASEGVYIKARGQLVEDSNETQQALKLLAQRAGKSAEAMNQLFDGDGLRVYKAVPEQFWINITQEVGGKFIDERVEIKLI